MDTPGDYRELGFSGTEGAGVAGNGSLVISRVSRDHAGFYLCQASNGIGPGLSKLIRLTVHGKIFTHCYECGSVSVDPARELDSEILQLAAEFLHRSMHRGTPVGGGGERSSLQSVYREKLGAYCFKPRYDAFRRVVRAVHLRLLGDFFTFIYIFIIWHTNRGKRYNTRVDAE